MNALVLALLVSGTGAREHYQRGIAQYDAGNYEAAISEFGEAYAESGSPALLFNLAQAHRLNHDWREALTMYQRYLRELPDAANRPDVERRIREMEDRVAETRPRKPPPPALAAPPSAVAASSPWHDEPPGRTKRIAGLATMGGGLALVGTGVYFGLRASQSSDQITQLSGKHGMWNPSAQNVYDQGSTSATRANVLYALGGATVLTGGALYWLGVREEHDARVAVAPSPGGAAVVVSGRFR